MENSAVDFYNQEIKELFNQFQDGEISGNMFHVLRLTALTKAKEMERIQKIKIQIQENESVLEMLRLHGNDSSIIRVFSRLESLKEQLKKSPFKSE